MLTYVYTQSQCMLACSLHHRSTQTDDFNNPTGTRKCLHTPPHGTDGDGVAHRTHFTCARGGSPGRPSSECNITVIIDHTADARLSVDMSLFLRLWYFSIYNVVVVGASVRVCFAVISVSRTAYTYTYVYRFYHASVARRASVMETFV